MNNENIRLLIIDDDQFIRLSLKILLEQHYGYVFCLDSPEDIPKTLNAESFDVILLDMNFKQGETSGKEGLFWLKKILENTPDSNVITITAYGDITVAIETIKLGAIDFIVKPWQNEKIIATVNAACKLSQTQKKIIRLKNRQEVLSDSIDRNYSKIIGISPPMVAIFETIEKVAKTDANVLILGENGTGKELVARAIHKQSSRANEVFINLDIGAVSETLFESELFGHKKGAFTDAKEDRIGRFEAASEGTLFLDEIGNLPVTLQAKLLTAIQNKSITRVGSNKPVDIDVRIICATNKSIKQMVKDNIFRQDLLYRINTVEISLPSLKDRTEDIPLIAVHYLNIFTKKYDKENLKIPEYVIKKLQKFEWPGNIRELQHAIERAVIMSDGSVLKSSDFSFLDNLSDENDTVDDYNLENLEKWAILKCLKKYRGNVSKAAMELGITRGALYRRFEKYGL